MLGMAGRSRERHPSVLTEALDLSKCISCGQCAVVCPVGAITERSEWRQVQEELEFYFLAHQQQEQTLQSQQQQLQRAEALIQAMLERLEQQG